MKDDPLNRLKVKRGEDLPQSKMTEDQVIKARKDYEKARLLIKRIQRKYTAKGLASRYGVHYRTMEKILSGESWSHLP